MTLQKLRYFVAVVNAGSLSEAAKRLFVTQPSLSQSMRELEEEVGVSLFARTNKGVALSPEGAEFLSYARQVTEQADLLDERYKSAAPPKGRFGVSTQHYAFVVDAFVRLARRYGTSEYEFTIRDARTHDILEDVRAQKSEIGVLYQNEFNQKVLNQLLRQHGLAFHPLFTARPHVFISARHPLAGEQEVTLQQLDPYPYLFFDQGEYNSFYFSEEILSTLPHPKSIRVTDRATIFNLMIGLDGYTISTGVISAKLNGRDIVAVPLKTHESITVGWIAQKKLRLSRLAEQFVAELTQAVTEKE